MTWDERVRAVQVLGFTERQAGFLVRVMLFAGVCLQRQYCTFAQMRHGHNSRGFFDHLVARRFATTTRAGHPRTRIYHVQAKALYRTIGEPDNRHRRPVTLARAVERLMVLDAVIGDRARIWLATEQEKVAYFTLTFRVPRSDLPALTFRAADAETARYFPDKLPIGVDRSHRAHVFLYIAVADQPWDFRLFLERHAELLRALPAWTIRLVVPRHKEAGIPAYDAAFREQLARPLRPALVEDLRWYFEARQHPPTGAHERFDQAVRAFGAPRFRVLYRAWCERGNGVLAATLSPTLADALARGTGQMECATLPYRYEHLWPLVGTA